ncbi:hypothetical protein C8F01DRAFT_1110278, partial [Mycena amicta]
MLAGSRRVVDRTRPPGLPPSNDHQHPTVRHYPLLSTTAGAHNISDPPPSRSRLQFQKTHIRKNIHPNDTQADCLPSEKTSVHMRRRCPLALKGPPFYFRRRYDQGNFQVREPKNIKPALQFSLPFPSLFLWLSLSPYKSPRKQLRWPSSPSIPTPRSTSASRYRCWTSRLQRLLLLECRSPSRSSSSLLPTPPLASSDFSLAESL